MSKQEDYLFNEIKCFLPNLHLQRNYRPDFLKNIITGNNLEIDIWVTKFKIGFEYQGAVHFMEVRRFKNDPDKSRFHDTLKNDLIQKDKSKFVIVEIFESDLNGNVKQNIISRIENTINHYQKKGMKNKIVNLKKFLVYLKYYSSMNWGEIFYKYKKPFDKNRKLREHIIQ